MRSLTAFARRSSARLGRLVVRVVSATRVTIRLDAQLFVLLVLDLELWQLELLQQPGRAFDGVPAGFLEPVPHGVAAIVVADTP